MTTGKFRLPPPFSRLAWSNLAAQSAEQIGLAATPIVAVIVLGAGAGTAGLLQMAQTLPFLLLSVPAGVLADRMSRRRLMVGAEALRAASLAGTLALATLHGLSLPLLALLGFVGACGTVAYSVSAPALVPALVPPALLAAANGRLELARTVAFAGGPALAGVLVSGVGGGAAFGLAALISAGAVLLLRGVQEPVRPPRASAHAARDLREGAGFVFRHPLLRPVFFTQVVFNTSFFVLQSAYVPYAVHHLGLSSSGVGVTLATYGVGMIVGALLAPIVMRALRLGVVIVLGPLVGLVAALVMLLTVWAPSALTVWVPSAGLAAMSFFLFGAGPIVWVISTATLRQTVTPQDLLGRATAINSLAYGARPLGAAIGALVGSLYGAETCLVVAAGGFLVQAWLIMASRVSGLERQPPMAGEPRFVRDEAPEFRGAAATAE